MRSTSLVLLCVALASSVALADKPITELRQRAATASLNDQPKAYVELAEADLDLVNTYYDAADVEQARKALDELVNASEKAGHAAIQSNKRVKQTEIAIRKMSKKLADIQRTVDFEQREAVQKAIDSLENMRTALLNHMFKK